MTDTINYTNLQKLHDYVQNNVDEKSFDMRELHYIPGVSKYYWGHVAPSHTCGTVGCILGYTPNVFGEGKTYREHLEHNLGIPDSSDEGEWLFSGEWGEPELSKDQHLARLQEFIDTKGGSMPRFSSIGGYIFDRYIYVESE